MAIAAARAWAKRVVSSKKQAHKQECYLTGEDAEGAEQADFNECKRLTLNNSALATLNTSVLGQLTFLNINSTRISNLDTRQLGNLTELWIYKTPIAQLDLTPLSKLTVLHLGATNVRAIDFRRIPSIQSLYCQDTLLRFCDVTFLSELKVFNVKNTKIAHLRGGFQALTQIRIQRSQIGFVDFRECHTLQKLQRGLLQSTASLPGVGVKVDQADAVLVAHQD